MPLTPIESIAYANQNMNVVATKQNDHQTRINKQAYAAVEESLKKDNTISEINELTEDKAIDEQQEHNREQAEKENSQKDKNPKEKIEKKLKADLKDDFENPLHILDIKA
jgi:hypothetical protein